METICYKQTFLKQVIFKLNFPTQLEELKEGLSKEAINKIISFGFPIYTPAERQGQSIRISQDGAQPAGVITEKIYQFENIDRTKKIVIDSQAISLDLTKYESYVDFKSIIENIIEVFTNIDSSIIINRIGVRYVNVINKNESTPLNWDSSINNELVNTLNTVPFKEKLNRAFHILEYNFDGQMLKFQFGISNPDYPALVKKEEFILDMDSTFTGAFSLSDIIQNVDLSHEKIQTIFENAITDELKESMQ